MTTVPTHRTRLSLYLTGSGLTATLPSGQTIYNLSVAQLLDLVDQWADQVVTERAELTLHGHQRASSPARKKGTRQK